MTEGIRPQYHFRQTDTGLDAWDVRRLIELSRRLPAREIDPESIADIHSNHWYKGAGAVPSPWSLVSHMRLVAACDLSYPIILDAEGRVMDGMHRVCKALLNGSPSVLAVQFTTDPAPDYIDCDPRTLPYEA